VTLQLLEDVVSAGIDDEPVVVEKAPVVERTLRTAAEARRIWRLYGAPPARRAGAALAVLARRLWAKLPPRLVLPIERTCARISLNARAAAQRLGATVSRCARILRPQS